MFSVDKSLADIGRGQEDSRGMVTEEDVLQVQGRARSQVSRHESDAAQRYSNRAELLEYRDGGLGENKESHVRT